MKRSIWRVPYRKLASVVNCSTLRTLDATGSRSSFADGHGMQQSATRSLRKGRKRPMSRRTRAQCPVHEWMFAEHNGTVVVRLNPHGDARQPHPYQENRNDEHMHR